MRRVAQFHDDSTVLGRTKLFHMLSTTLLKSMLSDSLHVLRSSCLGQRSTGAPWLGGGVSAHCQARGDQMHHHVNGGPNIRMQETWWQNLEH